HRPVRQVQLVVDHDDALGGDLEKARGARHGATGEVHERAGLDQDDPAARQAALADLRPAFVSLEPSADTIGQFVEHEKADVVSIALVAGSRVAEAGEQNLLTGPWQFVSHGHVSGRSGLTAPRSRASPRPRPRPRCPPWPPWPPRSEPRTPRRSAARGRSRAPPRPGARPAPR